MAEASREKRLAFIASFGNRQGIGGLARMMVDKYGEDWLTDEQVGDIADELSRRHRFSQKLARENRQRCGPQSTALE